MEQSIWTNFCMPAPHYRGFKSLATEEKEPVELPKKWLLRLFDGYICDSGRDMLAFLLTCKRWYNTVKGESVSYRAYTTLLSDVVNAVGPALHSSPLLPYSSLLLACSKGCSEICYWLQQRFHMTADSIVKEFYFECLLKAYDSRHYSLCVWLVSTFCLNDRQWIKSNRKKFEKFAVMVTVLHKEGRAEAASTRALEFLHVSERDMYSIFSDRVFCLNCELSVNECAENSFRRIMFMFHLYGMEFYKRHKDVVSCMLFMRNYRYIYKFYAIAVDVGDSSMHKMLDAFIEDDVRGVINILRLFGDATVLNTFIKSLAKPLSSTQRICPLFQLLCGGGCSISLWTKVLKSNIPYRHKFDYRHCYHDHCYCMALVGLIKNSSTMQCKWFYEQYRCYIATNDACMDLHCNINDPAIVDSYNCTNTIFIMSAKFGKTELFFWLMRYMPFQMGLVNKFFEVALINGHLDLCKELQRKFMTAKITSHISIKTMLELAEASQKQPVKDWVFGVANSEKVFLRAETASLEICSILQHTPHSGAVLQSLRQSQPELIPQSEHLARTMSVIYESGNYMKLKALLELSKEIYGDSRSGIYAQMKWPWTKSKLSYETMQDWIVNYTKNKQLYRSGCAHNLAVSLFHKNVLRGIEEYDIDFPMSSSLVDLFTPLCTTPLLYRSEAKSMAYIF